MVFLLAMAMVVSKKLLTAVYTRTYTSTLLYKMDTALNPSGLKKSENKKWENTQQEVIFHYYSYSKAIGFNGTEPNQTLLRQYERWVIDWASTELRGFCKARIPK